MSTGYRFVCRKCCEGGMPGGFEESTIGGLVPQHLCPVCHERRLYRQEWAHVHANVQEAAEKYWARVETERAARCAESDLREIAEHNK